MKLEELQSILFDILIEVDKVCTEENIPFMLCGGSALGAVRHHDIIPWDDDIDIMIWHKDLERLTKALNEKLPSHLRLIKTENLVPNFYDFIYRVQDTRYHWHDSTEEDYFYNELQNYLCVDIFFISYGGNTESEVKKLARKQKMIYALARGHRYKTENKKQPFLMSAALGAAQMIGKCIPMRQILKWQENMYKKCDSTPTKYSVLLNEIPDKMGAPFESTGLQTYKRVDFRDRTMPIATGAHEMLTKLYGDYMTPVRDRSQYVVHFREDDETDE